MIQESMSLNAGVYMLRISLNEPWETTLVSDEIHNTPILGFCRKSLLTLEPLQAPDIAERTLGGGAALGRDRGRG